MSEAFDFKTLVQANVSTCKGLVFRYTENFYSADSTKFVFQKQISLLKRKSCPGCDECYPVLDDLYQGMADVGEEFFEFSPHLKHGDEVELVFVPGPSDWETGYLDSWHYRVEKYTPPTLPTQNSALEDPLLE